MKLVDAATDELKFTATVLTYARHAQIGRVHYSRVSADIYYDLVAPEPGAVLTKLSEAKDVAAAAQQMVDALLSAGARREDITVISSEPFDEYEFAQHEKPMLMPWLVVFGAILGGIGGFLLVSLTTKSFPIATGGMPITPRWISGIITYELTMLAAILTTLLVLLLTAPLFRWNQEPYDVQVADGKVLVGINLQGDRPDKVKEILKAAEDSREGGPVS